MGNISLTKMWMAAIVVAFVVVTLASGYINFCGSHLPGYSAQCNIEPKYQGIFQNISNQYEGLQLFGDTVKDKNLAVKILDFGASAITGTVNVFVTGLDAMGKFFEMIPLIGNLLTIMGSVIPGFSSLISLMILLVGVYIAMRYIQSVSNKPDLP